MLYRAADLTLHAVLCPVSSEPLPLVSGWLTFVASSMRLRCSRGATANVRAPAGMCAARVLGEGKIARIRPDRKSFRKLALGRRILAVKLCGEKNIAMGARH